MSETEIKNGSDKQALDGNGRPDHKEKTRRQVATFYLDDHFFGVDVLKVQEILKVRGITRVPLAPPVISGLINLRGQIVLAIDLRTRLGFPPKASEAHITSVVVTTGDAPINLLVDKIGDVIQIQSELFEAPPDTLNEKFKEVTEGVYKLKDKLLLLLDIEAVINVS